MGKRNFPVISIGYRTGTTTADVAAAGAKVAIPTMEGGTLPKYLFCMVTGGTAREFVTISPTQDVVGAIDDGIPLVTENDGIILMVHGSSHIGTAASEDGTMELHLYPLEDF